VIGGSAAAISETRSMLRSRGLNAALLIHGCVLRRLALVK